MDPTLRLFFVEESHGSEGPEPDLGPEEPDTELAAPLAATFQLESHPGSNRTIFLDFNRTEPVEGTAWNQNGQLGTGASIPIDPYDTDGDPGSFSDQEMEEIQNIWQRVKEDFAPWGVNVTTKTPAPSAIDRTDDLDQEYGTTVVIDGSGVPMACGCGGIAYVNVFDLYEIYPGAPTHGYYQPAFVFQGGTGSLKSIAEAISHEAGHNLGLSHDGLDYGTVPNPSDPSKPLPHPDNREYYDGQFHQAWAPIMGVGYNKPLVQWNDGDYPNASNTQDDVAVMESNGLAPVVDDHGDGPVSLTPGWTDLGDLTAGLRRDGLISTRDDSDWFYFTTAGGVATIGVTPAAVSPNLDVSVSLWRDVELGEESSVSAFEGDPISYASSDVDTGGGLDVTDVIALEPGGYFVEIDGVGALDPATGGYSDYGSLGHYSLSITPGVCEALPDFYDAPNDRESAELMVGGDRRYFGLICDDDEDWFEIPGIAGATLTVDLSAIDPLGDLALELHSDVLAAPVVADAAGADEQLVHTFEANDEYFLRVRKGVTAESRFEMQMTMLVCPPQDQYETGPYGDDYPHSGYVPSLSVPGVKDATSCLNDTVSNGGSQVHNGDHVEVDLVAGAEFTATLHVAPGNENNLN